jgi:hypothetical protein
MLDGPHQPVSLDELVEDILQDIFCIAFVVDTFPDEVAKAGLFPLDYFRDPVVLAFGHQLDAERVLHLLV